jgi:flavodoxin
MNALVTYETQFGNTEQIAQAIANALVAHGSARRAVVGEVSAADLENLDRLIIGGPTQYHEATPDILAWLDHIPPQALDGLPMVVFDTRYRMSRWLSGSAAQMLGREIKKRGGVLLVPPESFFVIERTGPLEAGEIERAATWAGKLCDALKAQSMPAKSATIVP